MKPYMRKLPGVFVLLLFALVAGGETKNGHVRDRDQQSKDLTVHQITLVDESGQPKLRLAVKSSEPSIELLGKDGATAFSITLDGTGHPAITLSNPDGGSSASLAVDPKGAHVKFDRPGGGSSYLFLNDEGVSGVVMVDKTGQRRYQVLVNTDGSVTTAPSQSDGRSKP